MSRKSKVASRKAKKADWEIEADKFATEEKAGGKVVQKKEPAAPKKVSKVVTKPKTKEVKVDSQKKPVTVEDKKNREAPKKEDPVVVEEQVKEKVIDRAEERGEVVQIDSTRFVLLQRSQASVEIASNAKGELTFKVKAYGDTAEQACNDAVAQAIDLLDIVNSK